MMSKSDNLKVAVRVRPFNEREIKKSSKCVLSMEGNTTTITHPNSGEEKSFTFDYSYWSHDGFVEREGGMLEPLENNVKYADQKTVFNDLGKGVLENAWNGYNATLFAYGQTGSGKSYSMIGYESNKGIVPITCSSLFESIDKVEKGKIELQVVFSMLEIYNEQTRDLLCRKNSHKSGNLQVRENGAVGFYVEGLSQHPCRNYSDIERLMAAGAISRTTASTNMNATSSRSHMVITIKFKQIFNNQLGESTTKTSEINLVDLAGSERANSTGATGDRLKEGSAINTSLLMLGTVIEALASDDPKVFVPYRASVLTKLLKSALGGNSKTIMIAALSPADINYDETLSTLRYANRAKKIKNKAIVNESPTEKLIRELKAENARLLAKLSGHSPKEGLTENDEVKWLLAQNEQQMKELSTSWEQKLESARKQWEEEQKRAEKERNKINDASPYLKNVNEDPQLNGIIKHYLQDGTTMIGRCSDETPTSDTRHYVQLRGLGILENHCTITRLDNKTVIIKPCQKAEVIVNGLKIPVQAILKHQDRIKLGSNSLFLYIGFPEERSNGTNSDEKDYDYYFFQNELMKATGINKELIESSNEKKQNDMEAIFHEYVELMPVVAGLNEISSELKKKLEFSLLIKNLATCDEYGEDMAKEVVVKVTHQVSNQIWIWPKNKFINRRYLIEELYMKFQEDPSILKNLSKDHDPFWDPVEDVYLGCAHVWLHNLAYSMSFEDQVVIHNYSGEEEGILQISTTICSEDGELKGDDFFVVDSNELEGKRLDFVINISQCLGVKWIRENNTRGAMVRYKFFTEAHSHKSRETWHSLNPKLDMQQRFCFKEVDKNLINYFHSAALVVELWGLQAGRDNKANVCHENGSLQSLNDASSVASFSLSVSSLENKCEELEDELKQTKQKLRKMHSENNELRNICNILKDENTKLRNKSKNDKKLKRNWSLNQMEAPMEGRNTNNNNNIQVELGKALKTFFLEVRPVQRNLKSLKEDVDDSNVHNISKEFDHILTTLQSSVANAVRSHKMEKRSKMKQDLNRKHCN